MTGPLVRDILVGGPGLSNLHGPGYSATVERTIGVVPYCQIRVYNMRRQEIARFSGLPGRVYRFPERCWFAIYVAAGDTWMLQWTEDPTVSIEA